MSTEKNSAGEVQQAIKQGAVTREYKADAQRVIQALNGLRSTEVMSYLQYMQHQYMAVSLLSPGLKSEFQAHATQELDHANRLAERIQQLGGVPIYDPKEIAAKAANVGIVPEQGATLTEMVVEDLNARKAADRSLYCFGSRDRQPRSGDSANVDQYSGRH